MKGSPGMLPFILVIIGTAGLLVSEFMVPLGSATNIVFALMNGIGLIGIGMVLFRKGQQGQ